MTLIEHQFEKKNFFVDNQLHGVECSRRQSMAGKHVTKSDKIISDRVRPKNE